MGDVILLSGHPSASQRREETLRSQVNASNAVIAVLVNLMGGEVAINPESLRREYELNFELDPTTGVITYRSKILEPEPEKT